MVRRGRHRWLSTAGFYGLAALFMLPTVFVFYWMITLSLKPQVEAMAYPPSFIFEPTLRNYVDVFAKNPFAQYIVNSCRAFISFTPNGGFHRRREDPGLFVQVGSELAH